MSVLNSKGEALFEFREYAQNDPFDGICRRTSQNPFNISGCNSEHLGIEFSVKFFFLNNRKFELVENASLDLVNTTVPTWMSLCSYSPLYRHPGELIAIHFVARNFGLTSVPRFSYNFFDSSASPLWTVPNVAISRGLPHLIY